MSDDVWLCVHARCCLDETWQIPIATATLHSSLSLSVSLSLSLHCTCITAAAGAVFDRDVVVVVVTRASRVALGGTDEFSHIRRTHDENARARLCV